MWYKGILKKMDFPNFILIFDKTGYKNMVEQAEKPINNTSPLLNKKAFASSLFPKTAQPIDIIKVKIN